MIEFITEYKIQLQIVTTLVSLFGSTIGLNYALKALRISKDRDREFFSIQNSVITQRKNLSDDLKTRLKNNATPTEVFETFSTYFDSNSGYESKLKGDYYDAAKSNHIDILFAQISLTSAILGALFTIGLQIYS
jgi:hypothetical protein